MAFCVCSGVMSGSSAKPGDGRLSGLLCQLAVDGELDSWKHGVPNVSSMSSETVTASTSMSSNKPAGLASPASAAAVSPSAGGGPSRTILGRPGTAATAAACFSRAWMAAFWLCRARSSRSAVLTRARKAATSTSSSLT